MKNFCFLMTFLLLFLTITIPQLSTNVITCTEFIDFESTNSTMCSKVEEKYVLVGGEPMMYGFGLVLIAIFIIILINIFVKATKTIV